MALQTLINETESQLSAFDMATFTKDECNETLHHLKRLKELDNIGKD